MPPLYLERCLRQSPADREPSQPNHELMKGRSKDFLAWYVCWLWWSGWRAKISSLRNLHGLQQEWCEADGSKIPRSTVGTPTGFSGTRAAECHYWYHLLLAATTTTITTTTTTTTTTSQTQSQCGPAPTTYQQNRVSTKPSITIYRAVNLYCGFISLI